MQALPLFPGAQRTWSCHLGSPVLLCPALEVSHVAAALGVVTFLRGAGSRESMAGQSHVCVGSMAVLDKEVLCVFVGRDRRTRVCRACVKYPKYQAWEDTTAGVKRPQTPNLPAPTALSSLVSPMQGTMKAPSAEAQGDTGKRVLQA